MGAPSAIPPRLKGRPETVLLGIAAGCTNTEIAAYLKEKVTNVQNDVQKILHTLGVDRRTAAAITAIRQGIITYEQVEEFQEHYHRWRQVNQI